jgi:hypothetical protein
MKYTRAMNTESGDVIRNSYSRFVIRDVVEIPYSLRRKTPPLDSKLVSKRRLSPYLDVVSLLKGLFTQCSALL